MKGNLLKNLAASGMTFFNYSVPPLRRKQLTLDILDDEGLVCLHLQIGKDRSYSKFYTRIDQACLFWGILVLPMFFTAQFIPLSWTLQAGLWSVLSLLGTLTMVCWTHYWVKVERVSWVLYGWVMLMFLGLILTDLGVFLGWGSVLANLCPLWLGLSSLGYLGTGFAVRSRAILAIGFIHLGAILVLPYIGSWSFLFTGIVMALSLLILAEFQWDMQHSMNYLLLTTRKRQFNLRKHPQHQLSGEQL